MDDQNGSGAAEAAKAQARARLKRAVDARMTQISDEAIRLSMRLEIPKPPGSPGGLMLVLANHIAQCEVVLTSQAAEIGQLRGEVAKLRELVASMVPRGAAPDGGGA